MLNTVRQTAFESHENITRCSDSFRGIPEEPLAEQARDGSRDGS